MCDKQKKIMVKITSNGKPYGTRVVDVETGRPIGDICEINISIANRGKEAFVPMATLELGFIPFELECEAEFIVTCDKCGRKMKIHPKLES